MNEGQLMGDFESESKQLEAESWSRIVDSKFLKQQKKDAVKRQEVIYGETLPSLPWHRVPWAHSQGRFPSVWHLEGFFQNFEVERHDFLADPFPLFNIVSHFI